MATAGAATGFFVSLYTLGGGEVEGGGKEVGEGASFRAVGTGEQDGGRGGGELGDGLAAGSAGLAGGVAKDMDGDGGDADGGAVEGDGGGDGILLSAGGEAVGGVFDVAADDGFAGFQPNGGTYVEAAVGGVGLMRRGFSEGEEGGEVGRERHELRVAGGVRRGKGDARCAWNGTWGGLGDETGSLGSGSTGTARLRPD